MVFESIYYFQVEKKKNFLKKDVLSLKKNVKGDKS